MSGSPSHDSSSHGHGVNLLRILTIVFLYGFFASLWILLSDKVVEWLFTEPADFALVSTLKGFAFVAVTSLLLYTMMRRLLDTGAHVSDLLHGRRQLLWSIGPLALLIVIMSAAGIYHSVIFRRDRATAQLRDIADLKARQIEDWLAERYGDANFIRTNTRWVELYRRWSEMNDASGLRQLQELIDAFRKYKAFQDILLLDAHGDLVWDSLSEDHKIHLEVQAPAARQALSDNKVTHFGPYRDPDGRLHLDFFAPLAIADGGPGIVAVLSVNPADQLFLHLQTWSTPSSSGETLLFRRDGDQVLYLSELRHLPAAAGELRQPLSRKELLAVKILQEGEVRDYPLNGVDYDGNPVIGIGRSIRGTDWFLVAQLDQTEVFAIAMKDSGWIVLAGFLGLFFTTAGGLLVRQRQELADALRESAINAEKLRALQLLEAISEASRDAIFAKDTQGRYLLFNREVGRLMGKTKSEVLGQDDTAIFPLDQAELIMANDRQVMAEKRTVTFHERISTTDGQIDFMATKGPLHDADGSIIGMFGVSRDITELKQAEIELAERENYLRTILQTTADGFWVLDAQGRILDLNEAYCRMSGYRRDELLGSTVEALEANETSLEIARHISRIFARGSDLFETRHRAKDGRIFDVEMSVTSLGGEGGRLICFCRDITERKKAEAETAKLQARIQQAQKMESIGNLAGGIAHDFNNILFPIIGFSEMLLDDLAPDGSEAENVREIIGAAKRGSELVRQILAFSRQTEHKMIPVRVQQVLGEVLKLTRATIPSDIHITHDIQKNCPLVMADPTQVHQIAMNLITNAYHAVEQNHGAIDVTLKEVDLTADKDAPSLIDPGRYAVVTISDSGCGIDPAIMDKIFEPYFTTKEKGKGTGLGLSVVYGIVKEHKGDIRVTSEPGKGTTFRVYLPLMEKMAAAASPEINERLSGGSERILLVDDEEAVVRLEKRILERLGYRVDAHTSSLEALDVFRADPNAFDALLTDMTMPNLTGDQLAKAIWAVRPGMPVIVCTGFSERIDSEKAAVLGFSGLLMKPLVRDDLLRMLREALDRSKQHARE